MTQWLCSSDIHEDRAFRHTILGRGGSGSLDNSASIASVMSEEAPNGPHTEIADLFSTTMAARGQHVSQEC